MHPVFIAAVKRNQIGVGPSQEFSLVSTPPGTIPTTVRPPRIPELADAPIVVANSAPASNSTEAAPTRMAIAAPAPAKSNNLFGNLFSSSSTNEAETKTEDGPVDRMARLVGLRGNDTSAAAPASTPKPKAEAKAPSRQVNATTPNAAASNAAASNVAASNAAASNAAPGAIRPAPRAPEPAKTVEANKPAPPATAVAAQQNVAAAPAPNQAQAPAATAMSGATPVVPAGTFDSRWSAFR